MADTPKSPSTEVSDLRTQLEGLRASDPAPALKEATQRVGATVSDTASNVADTVSQAAASVADTVVPPLREGVERVRGAVNSVRETAAEVRVQKDNFAETVRGKPVKMLGVALLTGYVFGRIVR